MLKLLLIFGMLLHFSGCRDNAAAGPDSGDGDDWRWPQTDGDTDLDKPFEGTASGLLFDPPRGIYDAPVNLNVTHESLTEIRYTLDGSDPRYSSSAIIATLPLSLTVDPTDTTNRYTAPGVVIRATAEGVDGSPAAVVTHTYLFIDQVVALSPDGQSPGPEWPSPNSGEDDRWGGGPQRIDYGMDPDVTDHPDYSSQITAALKAIPSVSLVTDLPNLFDEAEGIYMNAEERGEEWERFCSVELLRPNGSPGFQANAGVRIRGGYSRHASNPKHAFRFYFRGDYGTPKLRYPLFGGEGPLEYDKIDLRTSQNYSWSGSDGETHENTMNRDVFSRDLQRELKQPYTRSRYYHLYINGVYWGLFQSQERSEARYAATYFGGSKDDYDVIKVDTVANYTIETTDGTLATWEAVWALTEQGFDKESNYYRLEGKDLNGARDSNLPVLVDVDNLIDYMLINLFTGNYDGPVSKFLENQNPNNFYAIKSRVNADKGFVFFAHDNEHSLMAEPVSITTGVDENRVSIGEPGGAVDGSGRVSAEYQMSVTSVARFHPQWLHHRLTDSAGYRERFTARAHELLDAGGILTPAETKALFQARADEIALAIIAESARWGDAHRSTPRTKNDDWLPAIERVMTGFLDQRTDILTDQLQATGLY